MAESRPTHDGRTLRAPFLIVNPKAYLYGAESLELAIDCEDLAANHDVDVVFTAQQADVRMIAQRCPSLFVAAQHMDPLVPGRGMGYILPEALVEAGARAVILNHAEHPVGLVELSDTIQRAREVGLLSIVCADTDQQVTAVAHQGPDVMICEPTANIGTGSMVSEEYVERTIALVRRVDPSILIIEAAGVSTADDVARVLRQGADGSGGTSVIVKAPDRPLMLDEMLTAVETHAQTLRTQN